jgi:hypothetical protein
MMPTWASPVVERRRATELFLAIAVEAIVWRIEWSIRPIEGPLESAAHREAPAGLAVLIPPEHQFVRRPPLVLAQRGVERTQRGKQMIGARGSARQILLTSFETLDRAGRRGTAVIVSAAKIVPAIRWAGLVGLGAYGIREIVPKTLLRRRDAKLAVQEVEAAFQTVVASIEAARVAAVVLLVRTRCRRPGIWPRIGG